jgi:beta-galactosidase
MCGEYWDGWFDHYGDKHHTASGPKEAEEIKWMLQQGYSVNLYMFHGGTSFGWMNGANSNGKNYEPDTTSYDYDSPVSEDGELSPKFNLIRDAIREATGVTPPDPPAPQPLHTFPAVHLTESASLWDNLPAPVKTEQIQPMENLGQSYGYILYRNYVTEPRGGELRLDDVHSYAQVYLDGAPVGTVDRRLDQTGLQMKADNKGARLDILVENTGRVNYGHQFVHERGGITRQVWLARIPFSNWENYPLPMDAVSSLPFKPDPCTGACFYRGTFTVDEPADTYLDIRSLGKGEVFVNGRPLGRAWSVGPQGALYLPAPWLHKGANEVIVFDLDGKPGRTLDFLTHPVLDFATK